MRGYWARDDPAFLLILLTIMAGMALESILSFLKIHGFLLPFSSFSDRLWSVAEASCSGVLPGFAVDCAQWLPPGWGHYCHCVLVSQFFTVDLTPQHARTHARTHTHTHTHTHTCIHTEGCLATGYGGWSLQVPWSQWSGHTVLMFISTLSFPSLSTSMPYKCSAGHVCPFTNVYDKTYSCFTPSHVQC